MTAPDPTTALPDDIPGVLARLDGIIDWAMDQKSPIGYFAAVYRGVTSTIEAEIARGAKPAGRFIDTERMTRFDVVFANRFLAAFDGWRDGTGRVSDSWAIAFATAEAERTGSRFARLPVLVHLLLGVNAHMNLDLGCAATEIAPGDEFEDLRGDFIAINAVLGSLTPRDRMQEERVAPLERLIDRWHWLSGHIIALDIEERRDNSWRWAEGLAPHVGDTRTGTISDRDGHVHRQGRTLLNFVQDRFWASPRHLLIRPVVLLDAWTTRPVDDVIESFAT